MEFSGQFINASKDWKSGQWHLTFSCNEANLDSLDKIKDADHLDISVKKHREKRSHDSNAYAWVLMQKIAETIHKEKWEVYLDMLVRYSRSFTHIIVSPEAVEAVKEMYRATIDLGEVTVNGHTGHQLQVYFGSSQFDTKEMSVFLEGIVDECKQMGIETATPEEIARMNAQWGLALERKKMRGLQDGA